MVVHIDISALFGGPSTERDRVDRSIMAASADCGFMTVSGLPSDIRVDQARRRALLQIFALPKPDISLLLRQKFDPRRSNIYRGWFPAQDGATSYKEGIDMGPD